MLLCVHCPLNRQSPEGGGGGRGLNDQVLIFPTGNVGIMKTVKFFVVFTRGNFSYPPPATGERRESPVSPPASQWVQPLVKRLELGVGFVESNLWLERKMYSDHDCVVVNEVAAPATQEDTASNGRSNPPDHRGILAITLNVLK